MYKIITKKVLNPTVTLMEIDAPRIAKKAEPGQFIILRVDEDGERIPLTIADFDREKAEKMVRDFGLDPSQRLKTMSKGQQEKLNLILVMCRRARLYILDEPLGGLDPAARSFVLDLIMNNYAKDATVLISTHLIGDVERIFDRVLMISGGRLIVNSHVDEIREKGKSVEEVFKEVFSYAW